MKNPHNRVKEYVEAMKNSDSEGIEFVEDKQGHIRIEKGDYLLSMVRNQNGNFQAVQKVPVEEHDSGEDTGDREWLYSEDKVGGRVEWVEFMMAPIGELAYKRVMSDILSENSRVGLDLIYNEKGDLIHLTAAYNNTESLPCAERSWGDHENLRGLGRQWTEEVDSDTDVDIEMEEFEDVVEISFEVNQQEIYREEIEKQGLTHSEKLEDLLEEFS